MPLLKLDGDVAQESIAILRRKRMGAVHHDAKFIIAERDGHGGFSEGVAPKAWQGCARLCNLPCASRRVQRRGPLPALGHLDVIG